MKPASTCELVKKQSANKKSMSQLRESEERKKEPGV